MLTIRHMPPCGKTHTNPVLRHYYVGLLANWNAAERALARYLNLRETGWNAEPDRRALGIAGDEWALALGRLDPAQMLTMRARKGLHRLINPAAIPLRRSVLKDKHRFDAHARQAGLLLPARFAGGALLAWLEGQDEIMVKPNFSSKGQGVRRLHRSGSTWLEKTAGGDQACDLGEIEQAVAKGAIVQQAIATHPAIAPISPNALPTMRVVTMRNESSQFEIVARILRVGGGIHPVDNFNRGGLAAVVGDRGKVAPFHIHDSGLAPKIVNAHPASDAPLPKALPSELCSDVDRMACTAHRAMVPDHAIVGWDIGLSGAGAVMIEGNWNPGTNVTQLLGGESVCCGRSGELYLHALQQVAPEIWRRAKPIQRDNP